ncbi:NAD(P)-dependent oxidoreductase [Pseudovibrio axinellae]|uniref:NAD(P)-dependent oxidoreductase n=2 Tax=Pseudovibrio axinellae TaxID=989403 RepID=UPI001AD8AC73
MIATCEFEAMSQRPILINISRGGLADEFALVTAINENRVSGIGFDVLMSEPATGRQSATFHPRSP